ncbi:hypothetical protein SAMN04488074_105122 [Lentzea albidocapillata subsp. violacea]|uniref:Uncharacterized protein n=1 Tax=Lentzea albidocapillata subsp. violacea TaxID=128104 RepID=A0A1G9AU68_9PSEU|nr:hypothetical protein [Lentzea albidocapillata]SDK30876.1 hypothetical protein SAMN04488074_105122 [Lentzea albidocapillata subsp. violacea]
MTSNAQCRLPECAELVLPWMDPDFCGSTHAAVARARGLLPLPARTPAAVITVLDETHTHDDTALTVSDMARIFDVDEQLLPPARAKMLTTTTAGNQLPADTGALARLCRAITRVVTRW